MTEELLSGLNLSTTYEEPSTEEIRKREEEITLSAQPEVIIDDEQHLPESMEDLLDQIMARAGTVEDVSPWIKLLIYGDYGSGKSVFTATAKNNFIFDIEEGSKSIRNHPELHDNVTILPYKSSYQVESTIDYFKRNDPRLAKFEVVTLDSFTAYQQKDIIAHVRTESAKDSSRNPYLPVGTDYNINTQHMKRIAQDLHDLERHVIITCLKKEVQDETGALYIRPDLTDKLAAYCAGMFDLVGYLTADIGSDGSVSNRRLQVHPTTRVAAKTRIGGLPAVIENPTFTNILEAYNKNNLKK